MLRLHDTARGEVRELRLREPGVVTVYVCGPTVYDVPHLGHGRSALVYDVLRRYLTWCGFEVRFVSNITDVDDNIIKRAAEQGRTCEEVVATYEAAWWGAMDALGVARPTADPHATAYVEGMVRLVEELLRRGVAYETGDGVYFRAEAVADYGLLAGQPLDELRAGARVDVAEEKRSPLDFALWKRSKPGEPTWPSPWGPGRPGWHTECVVMSLDLLGEGFDLHTGGLDLKFPHHENERAQAVALGRDFAHHWMHHGFVEVAGEKMSKSLSNFTSLADFLARADARAYRLLVLRAHYRSPLEVTPGSVADAEAALARLDAFARRTSGLPAAEPDPEVLARFRERMDDDLDTPGGVAVLFEAVRAANAALDEGDAGVASALAAAVRELTAAVGLELHAETDEVPPEVAATAARRDAARGEHDWATADALRAELEAAGWALEDTPAGTTVRRAR
ncbi:MAG: cysteine--tRNA ligase [Acidimicrobiales bacterium]|nr:cysteine--tRNA ligase [Acidimicrobiales bacterium]